MKNSRRYLYSQVVVFIGSIFCAIVHVMMSDSFAIGFDSGFLSFTSAFLGIEAVSARILNVGAIKPALRASVFWVFFKFLAPFAILSFGLGMGGGVIGVFSGLSFGLVSVAFVLRFYGRN